MTKIIGKVSATEKNPSTCDDFSFWLTDDTILSPFDITGYDKEMNDVSFLDYASSVLYPGKEAIWIKNQLKSACEFVEKVRKDYRNPASHKESIKMVTAAECLDYVINVQKKLKEMIVYMNH